MILWPSGVGPVGRGRETSHLTVVLSFADEHDLAVKAAARLATIAPARTCLIGQTLLVAQVPHHPRLSRRECRRDATRVACRRNRPRPRRRARSRLAGHRSRAWVRPLARLRRFPGPGESRRAMVRLLELRCRSRPQQFKLRRWPQGSSSWVRRGPHQPRVAVDP
jgi:hypothetical protein